MLELGLEESLARGALARGPGADRGCLLSDGVTVRKSLRKLLHEGLNVTTNKTHNIKV